MGKVFCFFFDKVRYIIESARGATQVHRKYTKPTPLKARKKSTIAQNPANLRLEEYSKLPPKETTT
jgi:hypothetical protein